VAKTIKAFSFVSVGSMAMLIIMYMFSVYLSERTNGIAMLFIFSFYLPFIVLGLIGTIVSVGKKIMSGIFMMLCALASAFIAFIGITGGIGIGIFCLIFGLTTFILYILSAILCFCFNFPPPSK